MEKDIATQIKVHSLVTMKMDKLKFKRGIKMGKDIVKSKVNVHISSITKMDKFNVKHGINMEKGLNKERALCAIAQLPL